MSALRTVAVSLLVAIAVLGLAEAGLRLAGFEREAAPVVFRFGYPNPKEMTGLFRTDPRLFWRFRPGSVFDAEAPVPINRLGYRGTVPAESRTHGLVRVAVMGDSVAFGSAAAWPEILAGLLGAALSPRPVEVLNFGVPGYTVVQGLRQFEDDVAALRPDVVIIAYGWNDHWIARGGLPDAEREPAAFETGRLGLALGSLRLTQALHAVLGGAPRTHEPDGSTVRRVPMPAFLDHLDRLVREVHASEAIPLVVGLPSGLTENTVPSYLTDQGFAPTARDAVADHARYVALARTAAMQTGVLFVDTDDAFAPGGLPDVRLFTGDRIHLSAEGHALMARIVGDAILRALPEGQP